MQSGQFVLVHTAVYLFLKVGLAHLFRLIHSSHPFSCAAAHTMAHARCMYVLSANGTHNGTQGAYIYSVQRHTQRHTQGAYI